MGLSVESVQPVSFAAHASRILEEAWTAPALRYSAEYLCWQLAFPAPEPLPAVAAFDQGEPVGFAAVTARRLRYREHQWHSGIVSFVAVRPQWRNRGLSAELYRGLLQALSRLRNSWITFAAADSAGARSLLRAYPQAGFQVLDLGEYPLCTALIRGEAPATGWEAEITADLTMLPPIISACASRDDLVWNDPDDAQLRHYMTDPRPRKLVVLRREAEPLGAAWIVRTEFRGRHGTEHVVSVESLFLSRQDAAALPALFRCAAAAWPAAVQPTIVSAPSLCGFDADALRQAGIRRTGALFHGYLCSPHLPAGVESARGTNLEVI
jgi:GNAT superfamily N-acetyltransferase